MEFDHDPLSKGLPPLDLPSLRTNTTLVRTSDLLSTLNAVAGYTLSTRHDAFLDGNTPGTIDNELIEHADSDDKLTAIITSHNAISLPSHLSSDESISRLYIPSATLSVVDPVSERVLHQTVSAHVSLIPAGAPGNYTLLPVLRENATAWTTEEPRIMAAMESHFHKGQQWPITKNGDGEYEGDESDMDMDEEEVEGPHKATSGTGAAQPTADPRRNAGYVINDLPLIAQALSPCSRLPTPFPFTTTSGFERYNAVNQSLLGQQSGTAPASTNSTNSTTAPSSSPNFFAPLTTVPNGLPGTKPSVFDFGTHTRLWNAQSFANAIVSRLGAGAVNLNGITSMGPPKSVFRTLPTPPSTSIATPALAQPSAPTQMASGPGFFTLNPQAAPFASASVFSTKIAPSTAPNPTAGAAAAPSSLAEPTSQALVPYSPSTTATSFVVSYASSESEEDEIEEEDETDPDGVRISLSLTNHSTYFSLRQDLKGSSLRPSATSPPPQVRMYPRRPVSMTAAAHQLMTTPPVRSSISSPSFRTPFPSTAIFADSSSDSSILSQTSSTDSALRRGSSRRMPSSTATTKRKRGRSTTTSSSSAPNGMAIPYSSLSKTSSFAKRTSSSTTSRRLRQTGTTGQFVTPPGTSPGSASQARMPQSSFANVSQATMDMRSSYTKVSTRTSRRKKTLARTRTPMEIITAREVCDRIRTSTPSSHIAGLRLRALPVHYAPRLLCSSWILYTPDSPHLDPQHRAERSHQRSRASGEDQQSASAAQNSYVRRLVLDNPLLFGSLLILLSLALVYFTIKPILSFFLVTLVLVLFDPHRVDSSQPSSLEPLIAVLDSSRSVVVQYLSLALLFALLYFYSLRIRQVRRSLRRSTSRTVTSSLLSHPSDTRASRSTPSGVPSRSFSSFRSLTPSYRRLSLLVTSPLRHPRSHAPHTPLTLTRARPLHTYLTIPCTFSVVLNADGAQRNVFGVSPEPRRSLRPIGSLETRAPTVQRLNALSSRTGLHAHDLTRTFHHLPSRLPVQIKRLSFYSVGLLLSCSRLRSSVDAPQ